MKKTVLCSVLLFGSFGFLANNVKAEDASNTGSVMLNAPETTNPVEPEIPGGGGTGQTGPLTIDQVPSFEFASDEKQLEGTFKDTPVEGIKKNVQVTDRRGTSAGWTLGVTISPFVDANQKALRGADINIPIALQAGEDNQSDKPGIIKSAITGVINTENGLTASDVITADEGQGAGTWIALMENAALNVKPGNTAGTYTSTFVWTLGELPAGN
ncbi:WxL domain-containing protein [Vagococcus zengguangii]|uniref:WxL domain-containing protein n=1 Tax=Vagococcus zengguangii TaxID=2571750 RepID=A0A4D7CTS2_9ENTE|nr:WxL domain-containing protein [Vagococcus zengguangii]QCI86322.1 WxL domain-containing protein [Vagococcus zengguangii]